MDSYVSQFQEIHCILQKQNGKGKFCRNEDTYDYCGICNEYKRMDNVNCYYVCRKCGNISGVNIAKNQINENFYHENVFQITKYTKYSHFKKYLDRLENVSYTTIEIIEKLFYKILDPFHLVCSDRKHFIRYEYVLIKFLELLDKRHLIKHFKMPKSQDTIFMYDNIWKQICKILNWKYIPSPCIVK